MPTRRPQLYKKRAPRSAKVRGDDWARIRDEFERLYIKENWILKDVMVWMVKNRNFFASERQYKAQIIDIWGMTKYNKTSNTDAATAENDTNRQAISSMQNHLAMTTQSLGYTMPNITAPYSNNSATAEASLDPAYWSQNGPHHSQYAPMQPLAPANHCLVGNYEAAVTSGQSLALNSSGSAPPYNHESNGMINRSKAMSMPLAPSSKRPQRYRHNEDIFGTQGSTPKSSGHFWNE